MADLVERLGHTLRIMSPQDDVRFIDEFAQIAGVDSRAQAFAALAEINTELGRANESIH
ncbi:MAG: hypothetical protein R2855_04985 [Thermomicrobiales bacterium]